MSLFSETRYAVISRTIRAEYEPIKNAYDNYPDDMVAEGVFGAALTAIEAVVVHLADEFEADNHRFQRHLFYRDALGREVLDSKEGFPQETGEGATT